MKFSKLSYICQLTTIGVLPLEVQCGIMRQDGPELADKQAYCISLNNIIPRGHTVIVTYCQFII